MVVVGSSNNNANRNHKLFTLLDLCVSSLRRGHANLLCIVPILTDDPRRESLPLFGLYRGISYRVVHHALICVPV